MAQALLRGTIASVASAERIPAAKAVPQAAKPPPGGDGLGLSVMRIGVAKADMDMLPRGLPAASPLARLFAAPMRRGRIEWIGLRPERDVPVRLVEECALVAARGILGDRYRTSRDGARQVTLLAAEHLSAIADFLGMERLDPALLRRNMVVRGVNLLALKGRRFRLGAAVLEHSGEAHPCSRMEQALGPGGYNAMRGHGGITARIITGGVVRLGDALERLE